MKQLWFLLPLLLGGCASLSATLENIDLANRKEGAAIVVVSGGAPQKCVSAATSLTLSPAGSKFAQNGILGINIDSYLFKSDYDDHHGMLTVFEVPAGSYQLYPYVQNPMLRQTKIPKAEFTVGAGQVVYIGEFFAQVSCNPSKGIIVVQDAYERDIALLRSRNPAFQRVDVSKHLATFTGYVE